MGTVDDQFFSIPKNIEALKPPGNFELDESRFRIMVDSTPVMTWVTDAAGTVQMVNQACAQFFGPYVERVTQPDGWHYLVHPDDTKTYIEGFRAAVREHKDFQCQARLKHWSGEWRWVGTYSAARFAADGTYLGHVGSSPDISALKEVQSRLEKALREKEILIKELYHRTKNNLNVVCSLLDLQARAVKDPSLHFVLNEVSNRIHSISLIHEMLYKSRSLSTVNMHDYLDHLFRNVISTLGSSTNQLSLDFQVEGIELTLDKAIPCGLIINELISNSLKHAFQESHRGNIRLTFRSLDQSHFGLDYSDDGVGFPAGFDPRKTITLGLRIVTSLTEQLGGELSTTTSSGGGVEYFIRFPK
jgi:PAS domain S-box-containing protein